MSNISDFNAASNAQTDREHDIQIDLLRVLCNAANGGTDSAELGVILDQLIAYSEVHFASEELLMRMNSYDEYEDHADDHIRMLETLQEIATAHAAGNSALVAGKADQVLAFITNHIATRDKRFADRVRAGH